MAEQEIFEFRGVEDLYVAKITEDSSTAYTTETPVKLSAVSEVAKKTTTNSATHYYDNKPLIVLNSEGGDEITLTVAPPELKVLAEIVGKSFDEETGMLVDGERTTSYFAIMYKTKGTDGAYRYVSRLKGTFSIPDETNQTEDDGTNTTNSQITYTGIYTKHQFNKGIYKDGKWEKGAAKGIVVDTRYSLASVDDFFSSTQTPDTITAAATE